MAPRHLICRVDIGAALQQQPHQTLVSAKSSIHERGLPLLANGKTTECDTELDCAESSV